MNDAAWIRPVREAWQAGLGEGRIRQNANESEWDIPADLKREILSTLADLPFNRYDFALQPLLAAALARYSGVPAEFIITGSGADELIQLCMMALPGPSGRIIATGPSFFVYWLTAAALGRELVSVPLQLPGFSLDVEGLVRTMRSGDVVFICRPNNPTGNVFPLASVREVVEAAAAAGAQVVVDEAYYEFCGQTVAGEIATGRWPHVTVLRTLSKAFRLAGLRLGYSLAGAAVSERLNRARLTYNVSAASMVCALGVLSRPELASETAAAVAALRAPLAGELGRIPGVAVYPSETNFLLTQVPGAASTIAAALAAEGVMVREFPGDKVLARCLRISVGGDAANRRLVGALAGVLAALPSGDLTAARET